MTQNQTPNPAAAAENTNFSKELFRPLTASNKEAEKISRPIISYWQDALLRIKRNKIAVISFFYIVFVAMVGIVGPFLFPDTGNDISYENVQDADYRNQSPTLGDEVIVTEDFPSSPEDLISETYNYEAPLLPPEALVPPQNFEVSGKATVNGVTLTWEPVEGVSGYQIYRANVESKNADLDPIKNDPFSRGLMVGAVSDPAQYSYTDFNGIDPSEHYVYSIVSVVSSPETMEENISPEAAVLQTDVFTTLRLSKAQLLDPDIEVGESIRGRAFLFGTDSLGRDVFARTVVGTRIDFFLALVIPLVAILIGLVYGSISGLVSGKVDLVMMRIVEILDSMPNLLFMVLLQVVMGKGVLSLIVAISATAWLSPARIVRGEVLRLREIEFVHASHLLGSSSTRIIFRHLAPNMMGILLVLWSGFIPAVIASEAFLSLLGLGLEQPAASWGTVLQDTASRFQTNPAQFFFPASVLGTSLLAFYLLGDALRDAFDPKLRGRE